MTPDRVEAACVAIESYLAGALTGAACAAAIVWVPTTHPLRWTEVERDGRLVMSDVVLATAEAIQGGERDPETLRAFAALLRDGKAEMVATGWWPTLHGSEPPTWQPGGGE